jgi:hypothetical protein
MFLLFILFSGPVSATLTLSALSFDGANDFAYVSFDPGVDFPQMTIQAWVRPERFDPPRETFAGFARAVSQLPPRHGYTKTKESQFLVYQDKTDWTRWGFYVSTTNADGSPAGETDIPAATVFDRTRPDQWYHLAVTYNGSTGSSGTVILYQDGVEAARATVPGDRISNILSIWFGRWVAATAGDMGMVAIHSRVLDQPEIQDNMSCGVSPEGLFAYWPFNACSTPSCFGMSGSGVVPVAIHSTADFDAGTVDPSTVKLGINPSEGYCTPRDWSIGQLPCAPGNHLIMHFDKACLSGIGVGMETETLSIAGSLDDGTSIAYPGF